MSRSEIDFDQPTPALQGLAWALLAALITGVVFFGLSWSGFGASRDSGTAVTLSNEQIAKLDRVWHLVGAAKAETADQLTADAARLTEARSLLVEVEAQVPGHPKVSFYRGLERLASGQPQEALEALRRADGRASAEDPSRVAILLTLSAVLTDLKQYDQAETSLRRALEIEPDSPSVWSNLGQVLWLLDRKEESIAAYRKKLELQGTPIQPQGPI